MMKNDLNQRKAKECFQVDGGRGWAICFGFFFVVLMNFGTCRTMGIFLTDWQREFNVSKSAASWVPSGCFAVVGVGSISAPFFARLNKPRLIVILGGVVSAVGVAGAAFATSLASLIALCILGFSGASVVYAVTFVCLGQRMRRFRPLAFSLAMTGSPVGGILFPYCFRWLADELLWRGCLFLLGACFLNFCCVGMLLEPFVHVDDAGGAENEDDDLENEIKNKNVDEDDDEDGSVNGVVGDGEGATTMALTKGRSGRARRPHPPSTPIYKTARFLLILPYVILHYGAMVVCVVYHPSLAVKRGFSGEMVSLIVLILGVSDLAVRFLGGFALTVPTIRSKMLLILIFNEGLMVVGAILLAMAKTYLNLILCTVVFGLAYGNWFVVYFSFLADFYGASALSLAIGISMFFGGWASLASPPIFGFIAESLAYFESIFLIAAVFLFLSFLNLLCLFIFDKRKPK